jgi:glycosyltransferase involved in cell wall biosynthesis
LGQGPPCRLAAVPASGLTTGLAQRAAPAIAFVLKGYPRLSETFIAQEVRALEERGFDIRLIALRRPTDPHTHPIHREIRAPVHYVPEYLHDEPRRVWRAWRAARRLPGYDAARRQWLKDLRRDPSRNRVRRFGQALVLAMELPADVGHLHAHFLHTPSSVARYAALLSGLPWTASAHAKDIWTTPAWEKREKLSDCRWLVTCTAAGHAHLAALARDPGKVSLVYHGIDSKRYAPPAQPAGDADGRDPAHAVVILSVGRAVAKKGYDVLLDALARLPSHLHWRFVHIGGGTLLPALRARGERLGLAARIDWRGPQPQEAVLAAYHRADIFALASRIAADGDRDGLPNVLLEAQSQRLACVSTALPGISELIEDGCDGLLVPADEPAALAAALARLIANPALRRQLGAAAEIKVRRDFALDAGIAHLAQKFATS